MGNDSFKVKKALNIEPQSAPNLSTDGDIGFNSSDSNLELYTGGSVKKVVTNSQAQTLTNKTLTAPTIDVVTLDGQASAPSNPSAGYYKVYVDDTTSKLQLLDSSGTVTTVGSGSGGAQNFITNGDAEAATTGWATYADAAGTSPVDGTGGSPTVTWTRSTSSPLTGLASFLFTKDAANRQGEGASYDFDIERADQAKVCRIDFDYEVASGTYADGDLTVWLYDVTNAQLIQPSASSILNAVGPQKKQPLSFQTNSNSTSYRLIIHVASTSASAYTVKFDNVSVTRESISQGTVNTASVAYTPTGGWTSNTTYSARWSQIGEDMEVRARIALSGAPTSATFTMSLPSGKVIDFAKMPAGALTNLESVGIANIYDATGNRYVGVVSINDQGSIRIQPDNVTSVVTQAVPFTFASGDTIELNFKVPIVGWSSSQQLSSDADTRVVAAKATLSSNQSVSSSAVTKVTFNQTDYDTTGSWSTSLNRYVVSTPGIFNIQSSLRLSSVSAAEFFSIYIYKNGSSVYRMDEYTDTTTVFLEGGDSFSAVAGDYFEIFVQSSGDTSYQVDSGASSRVTVSKLLGPAQIAASANVACLATGDPASASSGNPIIVPTTIFDTHQGYSASTGRYTCQIAGVYNIFGALSSASSATTLTIYKNGSSYALAGNLDSNGEATFSGSVSCIAGDIIDIRPGGTVDATSMSLNIQRLGGVG